MTSSEVCRSLGITYCQLNIWCDKGWLGERLSKPGTGYRTHRWFSLEDVERVRLLAAAARVKNMPLPDLAERMAATRDLFVAAKVAS